MREHSDLFAYQNQPLEFEIELFQVQEPGTFQRDAWELSHREKYDDIPKLKDEGNTFFKAGQYEEAIEKYTRALGFVEALEAANSWESESSQEERDTIANLSILLRLNYSAAKIKTQEYKDAIQQCSEVLKKDKNNQKALFRRGQAYLREGRELELAQKDFEILAQLDPSLPELKQEQKVLNEKFKAAREKEKKMFSKIFDDNN
jgi:tetratricopeptide (TPR) repeat protein